MLASVRLHTDGAPDLVLDPHNKMYYAEGAVRALAPHCARVLTREDWHEVDPAELANLQAGGKGQPYARLLWLAHALGSNGQLAPGLPGNGRYKLSRWPQIEREFPKHFRIATVMMKQPATLGEVAEQSGAIRAAARSSHACASRSAGLEPLTSRHERSANASPVCRSRLADERARR
jgi:hypothetical protein